MPGTITGNTAGNQGGGVYVKDSDNTVFQIPITFEKRGGIISGYASDQSNGNAVKNNSGVAQNYRGHAVYVGASSVILKIKKGAAVPGDYLFYIWNKTQYRAGYADGKWDN